MTNKNAYIIPPPPPKKESVVWGALLTVYMYRNTKAVSSIYAEL